jgi:hypothetical protein
MSKLVLAFDIERSGATSVYDTIAIGACVLNENYEKLDSYFCNCYFPESTKFEKRCYDEFWSKHLDVLESFVYTGDKTKYAREYEMIRGFQDFRIKWEVYAKENNFELFLCSDNNLYDGGFVNELIYTHLQNVLPIPYTAAKQEYETFFETTSMQKGLLLTHGISIDWGLFKEIKNLYYVPELAICHDHNPVNDAYTIAFEMMIMLNIQSNDHKFKIPRKYPTLFGSLESHELHE